MFTLRSLWGFLLEAREQRWNVCAEPACYRDDDVENEIKREEQAHEPEPSSALLVAKIEGVNKREDLTAQQVEKHCENQFSLCQRVAPIM